jgi:hypothetical protein
MDHVWSSSKNRSLKTCMPCLDRKVEREMLLKPLRAHGAHIRCWWSIPIGALPSLVSRARKSLYAFNHCSNWRKFGCFVGRGRCSISTNQHSPLGEGKSWGTFWKLRNSVAFGSVDFVFVRKCDKYFIQWQLNKFWILMSIYQSLNN